MKRTNLIRKIIYLCSILLLCFIALQLWLLDIPHVQKLMILASSVLLLIFIIGMDCLHLHYTDHLLIKLSQLIDSLINHSNTPVYSEIEDTLLSRLQSQVIKLSGIMHAQNKNIQLEKDEIKSFISDLSHQIKTPVAALKMFAELLQDPALTKEQHQEYLQILQDTLNKLTFLTDSLIKMSRLESGVIHLRPEKLDLNDILLHAFKQIHPLAVQKNIEIIFQSTHEVQLCVDHNWTTEAILNILDNAIKYTPSAGNVTVSIQEYESFVRVDIKDNGIGITEDELATIFKRFYRGKGSIGKDGIGLGLYLSRKIITDQGGYIKVQSGEQGSTFSIFLPYPRKI